MERRLYQESYLLEKTHWWHITKRELVLLLIKKYCQSSNPRMLDIGCGTGGNMETFSSIGKAFGLDSSKEALRFCRKRGISAVRQGTTTQLPYAARFFDVVAMLDVLEHTEDAKALKEVQRVLKPHGLFIVNVPAFPWLWSTWDEIAHHKRRYTKTSLTNLFVHHGFSIIKISYLFLFLLVPALVIRKLKSTWYTKSSYPSDFQLSSSLNKLLLTLARIETRIAVARMLPFGTSLFCVAIKE